MDSIRRARTAATPPPRYKSVFKPVTWTLPGVTPKASFDVLSDMRTYPDWWREVKSMKAVPGAAEGIDIQHYPKKTDTFDHRHPARGNVCEGARFSPMPGELSNGNRESDRFGAP